MGEWLGLEPVWSEGFGNEMEGLLLDVNWVRYWGEIVMAGGL